MIKASDLKVGYKICSVNDFEYGFTTNHIVDVLFILNKRNTKEKSTTGLHLLYNDIDYLDYAKDILNINLSLA